MLKVIPHSYFETMNESHSLWVKDKSKFAENLIADSRMHPPENIFSLSLPRRKRYLGLLPVTMELGLYNTPLKYHYAIYENIISFNDSLGNIAHAVTGIPDARHFLTKAYEEMPLSGSNLGALAHIFFHGRLELTGGPIFSIADTLYRELCDTDISKKTPCEFLRAPMPMMYLEFGQTRDINLPRTYNDQSKWHAMEGAYLNTFVLTDENLTKESESKDIALGDVTIPRNKYNVISHALATGLIKPGGGDVDVIEILVTGSPVGKNNILDDSTHQFVLVIQDRDLNVEDLLDWHIKYNKRELSSQINIQTGSATDHMKIRNVDKISDEEVETISNAVHAITKALLYINSETCIINHVKELTEFNNQIRRTKNKAKIRKLKNKSRALSDYISISLPDDELQKDTNNEGTQTRKKSHWKRAHFNTYFVGKGRTETRIKWIRRKLINANKVVVSSKEYRVK